MEGAAMSDFDTLYKQVVSYLAKKVNEKVVIEDLEEELKADHHLLQAVVDDLHNKKCILGHPSNHNGPREYDVAMVRPGIAKELAMLSKPEVPSTLSLNIQLVNGTDNIAIQGNDNITNPSDKK
jgi:hypothetical protein